MVTTEPFIFQVHMVHSKGTVAGILSSHTYGHPHHGTHPSQMNLSDTPVKKHKRLAFIPSRKGTSRLGRQRLSVFFERKKKRNIAPTSAMSHQQTTVGPSNEKQDSIWGQLCYARAPGLSVTQELKMH